MVKQLEIRHAGFKFVMSSSLLMGRWRILVFLQLQFVGSDFILDIQFNIMLLLLFVR